MGNGIIFGSTKSILGLRRAPGSGLPLWFNGLVGRFAVTRDVGALEPPYVGRDGMTCKRPFCA